MTLPDQNHYQTLGTSRFANAAEVRTAYLRLMKLYHPDVADRPSSGPGPEQLNVAYSVLRNPGRRAAYDAQIYGTNARRMNFRGGMSPGVDLRRIRQSRNRTTRLHGAFLVLAAGTAAAWFGMTTPTQRATASMPDSSSGGGKPDEVPHQTRLTLPPVLSSDVADALGDFEWIIFERRTQEVAIYSAQCFSQLAEKPDLRLLDRCIAFDLVASYLLPAGEAAASHYSRSEMKARHLKAADFLPRQSATARLLQLDRMTIAQISWPEATKPLGS